MVHRKATIERVASGESDRASGTELRAGVVRERGISGDMGRLGDASSTVWTDQGLARGPLTALYLLSGGRWNWGRSSNWSIGRRPPGN